MSSPTRDTQLTLWELSDSKDESDWYTKIERSGTLLRNMIACGPAPLTRYLENTHLKFFVPRLPLRI